MTTSQDQALQETGVKSDSEKLDEVVERTRRIETRLTKYLEREGFDTGVARAAWLKRGAVAVPTPATGLKEIIKVIPPNFDGLVEIIHRGTLLAHIRVNSRETDTPPDD